MSQLGGHNTTTSAIRVGQDGRMSIAPVSFSGRSGNLEDAGSNPDFVFFEPGSRQTSDFKFEEFFSKTC